MTLAVQQMDRRRQQHVAALMKRQQGALVSEIIGRTTSIYPPTLYRVNALPTVDRTVPDYQWWSLFRRGKQPGYEIGGLFAKPIIEIISAWVLGRGFTAKTGNKATDKLLAEFVTGNLATLMTNYKDCLGLGDSYLIVNPDGSLSIAAPHTVEIMTDDFDYRRVLSYKITTVLERVTVIDEYFDTERLVTFRTGSGYRRADGSPARQNQVSFETGTSGYPNPLGRPPVVHFAYGVESNEQYGHPVYEGLLKLFQRYDDLINKSLDGAEVMGRPVPVAYVEDPMLAQDQNKTREETVRYQDGTSASVPVVDFDDLDMLWLKAVPGAKFEFAAPGSFSADSMALLKKLFYLMLEHQGVPEWVWGGAIASSKASVDAQMPAFIRLIESWRTMLEKPLLDLLNLYLATISYFQPVALPGSISIVWPSVTGKDERLTLDKVRYASVDKKIVRDTTALALLDMIPDEEVEEEVEAAAEEAKEAQDAFDATVQAKIDQMGNPGEDEDTSEDDEESEDDEQRESE